MTEQQAAEFTRRYRNEVQGLTTMLHDIGKRGDADALQWLIRCFSLCAELTLTEIQKQAKGDELVKFENF